MLSRVDRRRIERDVRHLASYPTRHTLGRYHYPASDWLAEQLRIAGIRDVGFHLYSAANRFRLRNVVGIKPGKTARTTIVCGHFDSRMQDRNDSTSRAPGADDNGSGVAAILELARLLAPIALTDTLRFVFFSGEEQNMWGSKAYASQVHAEKTDIHFVFNVDEIGYPPSDRALFVDRDEAHADDTGSAPLVARIQELARRVVHVPTRTDPAQDSDYVPFADLGYVITGLYEAGKYPAYHTTGDTPDKVDYDYVTDMTRLALATLLTECA